MHKFLTPFLSAAFGSVLTLGTVSYVTLQASAPGTAENGNINVSGRVTASQFAAGTTAPTAIVDARSSTVGTTGVYARTNGSAVRGQSVASSGAYAGGTFEANSPDGWAVYGINKAGGSSSTAGYFESTNTNFGYGVKGISAGGTGLYGRTNGAGATAVYGYAPASSGTGGEFLGTGTGANIVGGTGMFVTSVSSYGVYANAPSNTYALYAAGNSATSGNKFLVIDNPADPTNSDLRQYCSEGDKPYLQYHGTANLDASGSAVVHLPEYFTSINKDASVQLTAVGASMPNLYQASDVVDGQFKIAGGKAGMRVNWQVTGIRNDNWVRKNGYQAIVAKAPDEIGRYRNPEFFGQPESKGIGYKAKRSADTLLASPKAAR